MGHAWRVCVPFGYGGFESPPLRHNRSGAQSLSLLALLLFDLLWFVGLVHLALIADAKLFLCLGLRFLRLFQRFVALLLRRAERPFDVGQVIMNCPDRRSAAIYGCRVPVNLPPPIA